MPEITEVYVVPTYRKRGIASEMITFAENYCTKNVCLPGLYYYLILNTQTVFCIYKYLHFII